MIIVRIDSSGGQQCLVFYQEGTPFYTHWFPPGVWFNNLTVPEGAVGDLVQLVQTMRAFGMRPDEMQGAVMALFKEKGLF